MHKEGKVESYSSVRVEVCPKGTVSQVGGRGGGIDTFRLKDLCEYEDVGALYQTLEKKEGERWKGGGERTTIDLRMLEGEKGIYEKRR